MRKERFIPPWTTVMSLLLLKHLLFCIKAEHNGLVDLCVCISWQQMDELQVIVGFVQAAKRLKTVCKWPWEEENGESIEYGSQW